jgi:hypothetical protein
MNKESLELFQFINGVWDDIDEKTFDNMSDEEFDSYANKFDKIRALICYKFGHDIGDDQCGKPEHRLCHGCLQAESTILKETQ